MSTVLDALNRALHRTFQANENVLLLGEDVLDPYGGAFKVTRGLSEAFPGRVLGTPISEAGIVGLAAGMALRGLRPIVEIMFGDFLMLAADQIINHAAKFQWMYNDQVDVPMVIRTPMGGRRGYGPTHSQTLEKHFLGAPGLITLAPCALGDPGKLLETAILHSRSPVLFIENKLLYLQQIQDPVQDAEFETEETPASPGRLNPPSLPYTPVYTMRVKGAPPASLTLAAYGYMVELARQAALRLAYDHEIFVELVVPTQLSPFDLQAVIASSQRTRRIATLEEGTVSLGWGAEVLSQAAHSIGHRLLACDRLAALDLPIPSSAPLENKVLPSLERIVEFIQKLIDKR